jgi:D-xylose transport system substrate-binding protein
MLADGTALDAIPGASKFSGGEKGVEMNAILLTPTPITKDTLNLAIDAGHITKEAGLRRRHGRRRCLPVI